MNPAKQVIKLKAADLDRATVRGLGRSIWEKTRILPVKEQIHGSLKRKTPKHKKDPLNDYEF